MSQIDQRIIDILRCPKSKSALTLKDSALISTKGSHKYDHLNNIPWLFKYPEAARYNWQAQTRQFLIQSENKLEAIKEDSKQEHLLPKTKNRLTEKILAIRNNVSEYNKLFKTLLENPTSELLIEEVLSERHPYTQTLNAYSDNVFRDWVWGHEENKKSIEVLLNTLDARSIENMIVLGAGACKLPLNLHKLIVNTWTLAVDINPLLLLTAQKLILGGAFDLFEFPLAPLEGKNHCVKHQILGEKSEHFHFLFADAIDLPVINGATDCVFTPWFCDIVSEELENLSQRINRYIKKDGIWIQFGPLGYTQRPESQMYSAEEFLEIVESKGFKILKYNIDKIPYLASPYSGQSRSEKVLTFIAQKTQNQKELPDFHNWPSWIINFDQPIPGHQIFEDLRFKNQIQFEILSAVDGKQSLNSISELMVQHFQMDKKTALSSLTAFFTTIFETHMK